MYKDDKVDMLHAVATFCTLRRALCQTPPTNLSFKFDDSLHAKGVCSLDGCQDTKKNPDQIIMILQTVSVKQSTHRIILDLPIIICSFQFFDSQIPSTHLILFWNLVCFSTCEHISAPWNISSHLPILLFSSSSFSLKLSTKNHCQAAS